MAERYVLVAMSFGEAEHTLECLRELDATDAGIPERPYSLVEDALVEAQEEGTALSSEQLKRVREFVAKDRPTLTDALDRLWNELDEWEAEHCDGDQHDPVEAGYVEALTFFRERLNAIGERNE